MRLSGVHVVAFGCRRTRKMSPPDFPAEGLCRLALPSWLTGNHRRGARMSLQSPSTNGTQFRLDDGAEPASNGAASPEW